MTEYDTYKRAAGRRSYTEKRNASPRAAKDLLIGTLKKFGIEEQITKYEFVLHWAEIMGPDIAQRTRPESLHGGVLTVRVCNSEWAQELVFQKDIMLQRLRRYLESRTKNQQVANLTDVRFFVGPINLDRAA